MPRQWLPFIPEAQMFLTRRFLDFEDARLHVFEQQLPDWIPKAILRSHALMTPLVDVTGASIMLRCFFLILLSIRCPNLTYRPQLEFILGSDH